MSFAELGSGFVAKTRSGDFLDQLASDIQDRVMVEVRKALSAHKPPTPVVNVAAPAAPQVTVNVPDIELPEMGAVTCTVEMPGVDQLVAVLSDIRDLLRAPVTRSVQRGPNGTIESIQETR